VTKTCTFETEKRPETFETETRKMGLETPSLFLIVGEKFQQMPKCRDVVEIINLETETPSKNSRPRLGT